MMIERILRSVQHVPAFPVTIRRVTELLQDENFSVLEVAKVIQLDQAITANILRMCPHISGFVLESERSMRR